MEEDKCLKRCLKILRKIYGYESFRPNQYEIISHILDGKDVCGILPTGLGKSITFQIPAIYNKQSVIIVSPTISLMTDQVKRLNDLGLNACAYNSMVEDKQELLTDILNQEYQFIYISPEMINVNPKVIKKIHKNNPLCLIAIDESHCISSYGFDFRESYRNLSIIRELLPDVPILALTATATTTVIKDMHTNLCMTKPKIIKASFDRPNLKLIVYPKKKDYIKDVYEIIKNKKRRPAIIYCLSKKNTEDLSKYLNEQGIISAYYHAGMESKLRTKIHHKFLDGDIDCICGTIAFGMGIDKPNIRTVIHVTLPKAVESYYQEIGRAGRDGNESECYMFWNYGDLKMQKSFITSNKQASLESKKHSFELLKAMEDFAITKTCRRKVLLNYFDEKHDGKCGGCDNCGITVKKTKYNNEILMENLLTIVVDKPITFPNLIKELDKSSSVPTSKWEEIINELVNKNYIKQDKNKISILSKGTEWITNKQLELFDN